MLPTSSLVQKSSMILYSPSRQTGHNWRFCFCSSVTLFMDCFESQFLGFSYSCFSLPANSLFWPLWHTLPVPEVIFRYWVNHSWNYPKYETWRPFAISLILVSDTFFLYQYLWYFSLTEHIKTYPYLIEYITWIRKPVRKLAFIFSFWQMEYQILK